MGIPANWEYGGVGVVGQIQAHLGHCRAGGSELAFLQIRAGCSPHPPTPMLIQRATLIWAPHPLDPNIGTILLLAFPHDQIGAAAVPLSSHVPSLGLQQPLGDWIGVGCTQPHGWFGPLLCGPHVPD